MSSARAGAGRWAPFWHFVLGAGAVDRLAFWPAWVASLVLLAARLWLARPFWEWAVPRYERWTVQPFLFQGYGLPVFSPETWAFATVAAGIVLPVLLAAGFLARWAALGLAAMAAGLYVLVGGDFAIALQQFPWIAVGLLLTVLGPGNLSVDWAIRRFLMRG